jgi:hypothetical protein
MPLLRSPHRCSPQAPLLASVFFPTCLFPRSSSPHLCSCSLCIDSYVTYVCLSHLCSLLASLFFPHLCSLYFCSPTSVSHTLVCSSHLISRPKKLTFVFAPPVIPCLPYLFLLQFCATPLQLALSVSAPPFHLPLPTSRLPPAQLSTTISQISPQHNPYTYALIF